MPFHVTSLVVSAALLTTPALSAQEAVSSSPVPVVGSASTLSVVPHYIKYAGTLPNAPGRASVVEVKFALYTNQTGGDPLWSETQQVSLDTTGKYSVLLGSASLAGVPSSIFATGQARWIGVTLGSDQESLRSILVATPYSFKAADADTLSGHPVSDFALREPIAPGAKAPGGTPVTQINVSSPLTGGGTGPTVTIGLSGNFAQTGVANEFTQPNTFDSYIAANSATPFTPAISANTAVSANFAIQANSNASSNGYGFAAYASNYPIFAQATDTTQGDETIGVYSQTFNTGSLSFGVYAQAQNGNGASGVYGLSGSASTEGTVVQPGFGGAGVWADTNQYGGAGASLLATADDNDAGIFASNSPTGYYTVYIQNDDTTQNAGPLNAINTFNQTFCEMDAYADFTCSGNISVVNTVDKDHKVASYSMQSAENWSEDFGTGQLAGGRASITIDPQFASTVNTGVDYHVFLTPNGDSKGLYIASKGPGVFEVVESNGGKSNIAFDYRIVAKRKGFENVRLADMTPKSIRVKTPSGKPYAVKQQAPHRKMISPADRRSVGLTNISAPLPAAK